MADLSQSLEGGGAKAVRLRSSIVRAEVYDNGCVLLYDSEFVKDEFGGLSEVPLDLAEFAPYEIDGAAYTAAVGKLTRRTA